MPGRPRVHELAREVGISTERLLIELEEMGELVRSTGSTLEPSVASRIRRRHGAPGSRADLPIRLPSGRLYPRNNPYSDLGADPIPHRQAADGSLPRPHRAHHAGPARPRREYWRGDRPAGLTLRILDKMIVPRRGEEVGPPKFGYMYYEDEVEEAQAHAARWRGCMFSMELDEILSWLTALDASATREYWLVKSLDDPAAIAIQLSEAGLTPADLEWAYGDEISGTLVARLRRGDLTVADLIALALARRRS